VREQVSHPYKTTGKMIVLYILIFTFPFHTRDIEIMRDSVCHGGEGVVVFWIVTPCRLVDGFKKIGNCLQDYTAPQPRRPQWLPEVHS
jgi:hypothetical protein